jgi:phosphoribosylanthranilate isomerase
MSRVRVKICGIRDESTLQAAIEAGADAVGFVVAAPSSPRCIEIERAAELIALTPAFVAPVVVSRHPDPETIRELFAVATPAWLQTDRSDFASLALAPGWRPLPVLREPGDGAALQPGWHTVLCEGADSGKGELGDWGFAAELARTRAVVLAGGLRADNVLAAIRRVGPYAVDVSSGVESAPGIKDVAAIEAFVAAVRRADSEVG